MQESLLSQGAFLGTWDRVHNSLGSSDICGSNWIAEEKTEDHQPLGIPAYEEAESNDLIRQSRAALYELKVIRELQGAYTAYRRITNGLEVYEIFRERFNSADREEVLSLLLGTKNGLFSYNGVSIGSLTCSIVHPRTVFKSAILGNASGIILTHNHPSCDPSPSEEDLAVTRRLKKVKKGKNEYQKI